MKHHYKTWEDAMSMPEVKCLIQLQHDNIVKLKEVIRSNQSKELFLIFELLSTDLHDLVKLRKKQGNRFSENEIQIIMYCIIKGVSYIHKRGFFHRDLKPDNVLVATKNGQIDISHSKIKVSDFGLCREINSNPPFTEYISTRWYRAPECVLKSRSYSYKMDIFAIGCIMAELFTMSPLLPGQSATDQFKVLCKVLGTPSQQEWPDAERLYERISSSFPEMPRYKKQNLSTFIPTASDEALALIEQMLKYDPKKRPSADDLLKDPYFYDVHQQFKIIEKNKNRQKSQVSKSKNTKSEFESMKITESGIRITTSLDNQDNSSLKKKEANQDKVHQHAYDQPNQIMQGYQSRKQDNSQDKAVTLRPKLIPSQIQSENYLPVQNMIQQKRSMPLNQQPHDYVQSKILSQNSDPITSPSQLSYNHQQNQHNQYQSLIQNQLQKNNNNIHQQRDSTAEFFKRQGSQFVTTNSNLNTTKSKGFAQNYYDNNNSAAQFRPPPSILGARPLIKESPQPSQYDQNANRFQQRDLGSRQFNFSGQSNNDLFSRIGIRSNHQQQPQQADYPSQHQLPQIEQRQPMQSQVNTPGTMYKPVFQQERGREYQITRQSNASTHESPPQTKNPHMMSNQNNQSLTRLNTMRGSTRNQSNTRHTQVTQDSPPQYRRDDDFDDFDNRFLKMFNH